MSRAGILRKGIQASTLGAGFGLLAGLSGGGSAAARPSHEDPLAPSAARNVNALARSTNDPQAFAR